MIDLISEDEFCYKALNVPAQVLTWGLAQQKGVEIVVRRDDLIDDNLSGNKFYKLFYNLQAAKSAGYRKLLSFGGAYSNHLYALAAAGKRYGFETIGVIRGERPKHLSPTLIDAENWGMKLHFVSRAEYSEPDLPLFREKLYAQYGDFYQIPEGAANANGVRGAKTLGWAISEQLKSDYTAVCMASATGNTLAGVSVGLQQNNPGFPAIGFSVLKGESDLGHRVIEHQLGINNACNNWCVISGYHGGGYAKKLPTNLRNFYKSFGQETQLRLDPVYTLKMVWGVAQLLEQNYWARGSRLVLIHTGGLQGCRGFNY